MDFNQESVFLSPLVGEVRAILRTLAQPSDRRSRSRSAELEGNGRGSRAQAGALYYISERAQVLDDLRAGHGPRPCRRRKMFRIEVRGRIRAIGSDSSRFRAAYHRFTSSIRVHSKQISGHQVWGSRTRANRRAQGGHGWGGRVWFGSGSVFFAVFRSLTSRSRKSGILTMSIMIVDDNRATLKLARVALECEGPMFQTARRRSCDRAPPHGSNHVFIRWICSFRSRWASR